MRTQSIGSGIEDGSFRLETIVSRCPSRRWSRAPLTPEIAAPLRAYIPGAVLNSVTTGQAESAGELRPLTLLYVNLPTLHHPRRWIRFHNTMRTMQRALYRLFRQCE
jgi:hypothetical protein